MLKQRILSSILFLAVAVFFPAVVSSSEIDLNGESLEYYESEKYIIVEGSVTVKWENKTLNADKVEFWTEKKFIKAEGNVVFNDGKNIVKGGGFYYDLEKKKGDITYAEGIFAPWYFRAKKLQRHSEKEMSAAGIWLTTCDLKDKHYYIKARSAKVIIDKRMIVYHPVFYIDGIPFMYLPFMSQGLGPHSHSFEVQPGYNNEDGFILKMIYGYPLSMNSYGKIYADYFGKRGWGKGLEYNYYLESVKGTLYGYHIKEKTTGNERWNVRASHWQRLNDFWIGQGEINYLSDRTLKDSYFQESYLRVNESLGSHFAFTRQGSNSVFRIYSTRKDSLNLETDDFEPESMVFPGIYYYMYPFKKNMPFYTSLSVNAVNEYSKNLDYYRLSAESDINIYNYYRFGRKLTFNPRLGILETWQDKASKNDFSDIFVTRYYSNLNLRYRPSRWVDWDLRHNYKLRSQNNQLYIDIYSDDYGVETDLLSYTNSMYPHRRVTFRNTLSYDLRYLRSEVLNDWRQKFLPLVNELTWLPKRSFFIYTREESNLYPHYLQSVLTEANFGDRYNKYFKFGFFYHSKYPDKLDLSWGAGFWPSKKWRIDYEIRASEKDDFRTFETYDQQLRIYRNLHCWNFNMLYRKRLEFEEVYFKIDLKSATKNRDELYSSEHESEFYPWRDQ